jgi:hypothetical protein
VGFRALIEGESKKALANVAFRVMAAGDEGADARAALWVLEYALTREKPVDDFSWLVTEAGQLAGTDARCRVRLLLGFLRSHTDRFTACDDAEQVAGVLKQLSKAYAELPLDMTQKPPFDGCRSLRDLTLMARAPSPSRVPGATADPAAARAPTGPHRGGNPQRPRARGELAGPQPAH